MIAELKEMGIELMVSIWPTVDYRSENFDEMMEKGYLIRTDRGFRIGMDFQGNTIHYDATNPGAREYVWQKAKKNYYDKGVKLFWLDEAEPEYTVYDFDNYRYYLGPNVQVGNWYPVMYAKTFFDGMQEQGQENILNLLRCAWANYYDKGVKLFWLDEAEPEYTVYDFDNYRYYLGPNVQVGNWYPVMYAKTFFDGMQEQGQENILNLLRCAWAGSQKYGALVWSGDIHSSFSSLRNQFAAGLNMGLAGIPWWTTDMAGIPWWTTDIGGFHGGWVDDPNFHELLIRWFEYGTFCPVMRLHGDREPHKPQYGTTGGATCVSGADNEVWSYSPEVLDICTKYLFLRERLRPYVTEQMKQAHEKGTPVMRPLFYDFPQDKKAWEVEDEYLFGPDILVAPVMYAKQLKRSVYLPEGASWTNAWTKETFDGGQRIDVDAPIDCIPLFLKDGVELPIQE